VPPAVPRSTLYSAFTRIEVFAMTGPLLPKLTTTRPALRHRPSIAWPQFPAGVERFPRAHVALAIDVHEEPGPEGQAERDQADPPGRVGHARELRSEGRQESGAEGDPEPAQALALQRTQRMKYSLSLPFE
jgi:hypothetical protein